MDIACVRCSFCCQMLPGEASADCRRCPSGNALVLLFYDCHLQGSDFTLYSKTVGYVNFRQERVILPGRAATAAKQRKYIDILPITNDWSAGYHKTAAEMVARRGQIRQERLGLAAKYGKK